MGGNLLQRCLSFLTIVIISRYLGPDKYGQYTFVMALVTICAVVWEFGLNTLLIRDIAADRTKASHYLGGALWGKSFFFLCILLLVTLLLIVLSYERVVIISTLIFGCGFFISTVTGTLNTSFQAHQRMEFTSLLNIMRAVFLFVAIFFLAKVYTEVSVEWVFWAYLFSFVAVLVVAVAVSGRYFVLPSLRCDLQHIKKLLTMAAPFLMISVVDSVLFRIDHLMLSKIVGNVELGLYGAAYTLFEIVFSLFAMMLISAVFPVLSTTFKEDRSAFPVLCNTVFKTLLLIGVPAGCGIILLSEDLIRFVYGTQYGAAAPMLMVLGGAIWIFFVTTYQSWTLTAAGEQNAVLRVTVAAMCFNIVLNLLLIPYFQAVGAACATLCSELLRWAGMSYYLRRRLFMWYRLKFAYIVASALVMSFGVLVVKHLTQPLGNSAVVFASIATGVLVYGLCALKIMPVMDVDEFLLLRGRQAVVE